MDDDPRPAIPDASPAVLLRLGPYLRPHRGRLAGAGVAALAATLAGLAVPLVTRAIVDGPIARRELGVLPWLVLGVLAFGLAEAALILLRRRLVARAVPAIETRLRADLFAHLQRLPVAFHDRWPSGQLLSRATTDLTTVRWFLAFSGIFLVVNSLTTVAGIAVLLWLSPWLGLVVAVTSVPLAVAMLVLERRYARAAREAQDRTGDLTTSVEESAQGIRVLKALGHGPALGGRFRMQAHGLRGVELRKVGLIAQMWVVLLVLLETSVAVVLAVGAYGVARGTLTLGTLIAAVSVVAFLHWPVASLGWLVAEAGNAAAAVRRYWEVRDVVASVTDPGRPAALPSPVRGEVRFSGVRFRHPGADGVPAREVLRGVDLVVRPGETMALVGATGSGKTTLTALVPRLHDVTGGAVEIDGVDVRRLPLATLRETVATAFEDAVLMSASVRENVALAPGVFTDAQVWEALRVASADGFVAALPHGLDTRIGEQGLSLSGGQRQRLALARAVIGHPPVLVLDDPLSALDVHTEAEVEAALRRVLGGVTALVVAHRPSTVQLADRVALLHEGRIAAVGTHAALLASEPRYRALLAPDREEART